MPHLFTASIESRLQKGGVPAAPSGTATLLRLSPNHRFCPRPTPCGHGLQAPRLSWLDGRCVQGRERIHRAMADARLLANPASWGRVADPSPNWDAFMDWTDVAGGLPCTRHCNTCVAPDVRAVLI